MNKPTIPNGKKSMDVLVQLNIPMTKRNTSIIMDLVYADGNNVIRASTPALGYIMFNINNGDMCVQVKLDNNSTTDTNGVEIFAKENMITLVQDTLSKLTGLPIQDIDMSDYEVVVAPQSANNTVLANPVHSNLLCSQQYFAN